MEQLQSPLLLIDLLLSVQFDSTVRAYCRNITSMNKYSGVGNTAIIYSRQIHTELRTILLVFLDVASVIIGWSKYYDGFVFQSIFL